MQREGQEANTAPVFDDPSYVFNFDEMLPIGSIVGNVSATDEERDPITFSINFAPVLSDYFEINSINGIGIIRNAQILDREDILISSFSMIVAAQDSFNPAATVTVVITVLDINDNRPVFTNLNATRSLQENTNVGTSIFTVQTRDADEGLNSAIFYSMVPNNTFSIGRSSGVINLILSLDYDVPSGRTYELIVTAEDRAEVPLTSSSNLTIYVMDVNDQNPIFEAISYSVEVHENLTMGTSVISVRARDQDEGINDTIIYSINDDGNDLIDGTPSFAINENTGLITVNVPVLDRETHNMYDLEIQASESSSLGNKASTSVAITIFDINDHIPSFAMRSYNVSISELANINTSVISLVASDPDEGVHGSFEFSIYNLLPDGELPFAVSSTTIENNGNAEIFLIQSVDFETQDLYRFMVVATETVENEARNGTAVVEVRVDNENDNNPVFLQDMYFVMAIENDGPNVQIATVMAQDEDRGVFGELVFSLSEEDVGKPFNISTQMGGIGVIRTTQNLNFEDIATYVLTVVARDGTEGNQRFNTSTVTVEIQNLNDNEPFFVMNGNQLNSIDITVPEEVPHPLTIFTLEASDLDGNLTDLTFAIVRDTSPGYFEIDQERRLLNTTLALDFDFSTPNFTLDISVSDTEFASILTIYIEVIDINDNSPIFDNSSYIFDVVENTAIGYVIGQVEASDRDSGTFGQVEYTLTGSADSFQINRTSGEIFLALRIDRELTPGPLMFSVIASDLDENQDERNTDMTSINVNVLDANDNTPSFARENYEFSVPENTDQLDGIGVNANDIDIGINSMFLFSIVGGNDEGAFFLDSSTGSIIHNETVVLDYERIQSYALNISVRDFGSPSNEANTIVSITITDENDVTPTFSMGTFNASVNENTPPNSFVIQIEADDVDSGEFGRLSYFISEVTSPSSPTGTFVIDESSGMIRTTGEFDRETFAEPYLVTINVRDNGSPPNNNSATLVVTILDVNDQTPMSLPVENFSPILEEGAPGIIVARVSAIDMDQDNTDNSRIDFNITAVSGLPAPGTTIPTQMDLLQIFYLNISNNMDDSVEILTNSSLDFELIRSYEITISFSDNGVPKLSSDIMVPVSIMDINDNTPDFIFPANTESYSESLREDVGFTRVLNLMASDQDSGVNAMLTFEPSSNFPSGFDIQENQLVLITNSLDFEIAQDYNFNVTVRDGGIPSLSSEAQVNIVIVDVNDNSPIFSQTRYNAEVDERDYSNSPIEIIVINATDLDSNELGTISFAIFPTNPLFSISNAFNNESDVYEGLISVVGELDRELIDEYTIIILARDGGIPPNTATATLTIRVNDINDNNPILSETEYRVTIPEESGPQIITDFIVSATDMDLGSNSIINFTISNDTYFEIDRETGVIRTRRSFDFEVETSFVLEIIAIDNGFLSDSALLIVNISDINDNTPFFISFPLERAFMEDIGVGTVIANIMADDLDSGNNAELVFQLANDQGRFSIDANGVITLAASLDRELTDSYNLTVTVSDRGQPPLTDENILYVEVIDVNDVEPQFERDSYNFLISEDININSTLGELIAFDLDEGQNGNITFDIVSGDTSIFSVETFQVDSRQTYSVILINNQAFDYENVTSYSLRIMAQNLVPSFPTFSDVFITIRDTNDNAPVFSLPSYIISVPEATMLGMDIGTVVATDVDGGINGTVMYRIPPNSDPNILSTFSLDRLTGVITLISILNFENVNIYDFYVEASDTSAVPLSSIVNVTIFVQDTNEAAPEFDSESYSGIVRENLPAGTVVTRVNATEKESGGASVVYSFRAGNTQRFNIDEVTGIITTSTGLDREEQDRYVLTVQASDMAELPLSSFVQVSVNVEDVNDNGPIFAISSAEVNLLESSPAGTRISTTFLATDRDIGTNADIQYFLPLSSPFVVNSSTGVISVRDSNALDRESSPVINLILNAQDSGSPVQANQLTIRVVLGDINDNQPTFIGSPYSASVSEGSDQGIAVVEVIAMDLDIEPTLTYAITSGDDDDNKFTINERTGLIETTSSTLDRETRDSYDLVVSVTDSVAPTRISTTIVTISVTDVNDHTPVCLENPFMFTTEEDNQLNVELGNVIATDGDQVPGTTPIGSGQLLYQLSGSNFRNNIMVTPTGTVIGLPVLDFEALIGTDSFSFDVLVSDRPADSASTRSVTCGVNVMLIDTNDNIPFFDERIYDINVREDVMLGESIIDLEAQDRDLGTNGDIRYNIQTPTNDFEIDSLTGVVRVSNNLDRETINRYELDVEAVDLGLPSRIGTTRLIITVLNVNDDSPRFDRSFYDVAISEASPLDTTVITVLATDPDNTVLTHMILQGDDNMVFRIDSVTGVIQVSRSLNREDIAVFNLVVIADDGQNNATTALRITLTDVNDEAPEFTQAEYTAFINENSPEGTPVLAFLNGSRIRIQAIDNDEPNTANSLVSYRLEGMSAPLFNIESTSGIITVARGANLDYESRSRIPVTVIATDSNFISPMSTSVMLYVELVDVNDEPPIFSSQFGYVLLIPEDVAVGTTISSEVMATDRDSVGGTVRYALTNANPFSALEQFIINRDSGDLVLVQTLDRENDATITLVVTASDMGEPSLSSVVNVQITVTDINDNPPQFGQLIFTATVPEYLARGTSVLRVTATDPDAAGANSEVQYTLAINSRDPFTINPVTGTIATTDTLDYETRSFYIFQAMACDKGSPIQCSSVTIRINVADFNDESPQFDQDTYNIDICFANAVTNTTLIQPVATDRDSGSNSDLSYSLETSPPLFTIDSISGRLSLATDAADINDFISLIIVATDKGDSPLSGTTEVVVRILNCSETNFYFESPFTYVEILEGLDILVDGRSNIMIPIFGVPNMVDFFPGDRDTNPFTNILNILQLKPFGDLSEDLRQGTGLDHEARDLYTVVIRAASTDGQDTYSSITLRVLDENDNAPEFVSDLLVFTTQENQTAPIEIGSVEANDRDEGTNGVIMYSVISIIPPSTPAPFTIDSTSGTIFTSQLLDRESNTNYNISIQAFDGVNMASTLVIVVVEDVNDCDPTFVEDMYEVSINENIPAGSSAATVRATDCDEGTNAIIQYTIINGSLGVFELDLISGIIRTLINLDFEQTSSYNLIVSATDMGSIITRSGTVSVLFQVADINDCPPEFINPSTLVDVPESITLNSVLQTYLVQDCDSGLNGINGTRFSIIAGNEEGVFDMNPITGGLRVVSPLDRELQTMYVLSIQAMDSAGVNSLSSIIELTVAVQDVNDNAPIFAEDEIFVTVNEGEELNQPLITVQASDADSGRNAQVTYSLAGGEGIFSIGGTTGELVLTQTLDRETQDLYVLSVVGRDGGVEPRSSNITIIVSVEDENDNDPEIINIISRVTVTSVPESSGIGTTVFTVNATDRDLGSNGNIRYLLDGLAGLPFGIAGGVITVTGDLDFERQTTYSLVVIAEDMGTPNGRRDIATLIVEVTDSNDNNPMFLQSLYVGNQDEGVNVGTSILTVQASDRDESNTNNSIVVYSLDDSQHDAQYFIIDGTTGIISNNVTLDRESRGSFMIISVATNALSDVQRSGTAMVTITVGDVNDEVPIFGQDLYTAVLPERTPLSTSVLRVNATDGDLENTPNSDVSFSLSDGTNIGIPFHIDQNTGEIIVQNELDYEVRVSYQFDVVVQDKGFGPLTSIATVMVNLTDVNDQLPVFNQPQYTASIVENSPGPLQLPNLVIEYSDGDTLTEHTVSNVSIVSVNSIGQAPDDDLFSIDLDPVNNMAYIIVNDEVDAEVVESFKLLVMVANNEDGVGEVCGSDPTCRLSNSATVDVIIVDTNDNPPVFQQRRYNGEVRTLAPQGSSVLTVTAFDADRSSEFNTIVYELVNSGAGLFRIEPNTGVIMTNGNFETLDGVKFELSVTAKDNNGVNPTLQDITEVFLFVLNDFQRFAIVFNTTFDVIERKMNNIVTILHNFTGYEIIFEEIVSTPANPGITDFIFYATDNGNIIDFTEFSNRILNREDELFRMLSSCNITRITSVADLVVYDYPSLVDTETIVILILCFLLIVGSLILLIVAFRQRYIALHAARHKLLADVFYGSHAGSSIIENIHTENIQLELIENTGQSMNKKNPVFVHPYDNWAGVDTTSGVESVGEDSNLQRDNPLYESQEIRMEMFADVSDEEDEGDEADEAELLAAALQDDSDIEDEDNSVTAI